MPLLESGGVGEVGGGCGELSDLSAARAWMQRQYLQMAGTLGCFKRERAGPHRLWGARLSLSCPCSHPSPAAAGREGAWEAG